jgi:uncharacterized protein DUF3892
VSYRLQIDCTRRDDRLNPYERIRAVGGPNVPGTPPPDASKVVAGLRKRGLVIKEQRRWRLPVEDAIEAVLGGKWSFFIELGVYDLINVEVAESPSGRLYLKTEADQETPDQLLYLPQCR